LGNHFQSEIRAEDKLEKVKIYLVTSLALCIALLTGCGTPKLNPTPSNTFTPVSPTSPPLASPEFTRTIEPSPTPGKVLLIYDDDGSRDGMAALLYLLGNQKFSIQAVNISYGEAHPKSYIQLMGNVLDRLGFKDIPLGAGQDMPLAGGTPFPEWLRRLSENFWDYPLPKSGETYSFQGAPELMVSQILHSSQPVTLFVSGPFSNLAQALRLEPKIVDNISAVYFMGGAVNVPGNIRNLIPDSSNQVAEWNIIADPQAAKEVFESGLALFMVPLDATNRVIIAQDDIRPWHIGDEKADMAADLYDIMFNNYGFKKVEIFDLTAAVIMANPETCNFQPLYLSVVTDNGPSLGQTVVMPDIDANIQACLNPNTNLIMQYLNEAFSP
jgi:purine nucleosidase/pyrimidine-specific ribonucleoside hydrolase